MQTRRFVKYAGGALAFGVLASAVAIGAVAPVDRTDVSRGTASASAGDAPSVRTAQNGGANASASKRGFTPSEEISADLPVSFPADI